MPIYEFRNFYLNTIERRVIKNGKYLELTPKTFDVLRLLVEKRFEIVTKDEILAEVWNNSFVEEGNLPVHVSKLRRLLNETKDEPFIETVQGSGYRFISPVQSMNEDDWKRLFSDKSLLREDNISEAFTFDSIAVLPLQNESDNSEIDYLADGLTESFINSLSQISDLKVIARNTVFRYKNKEADPKEIGETLGVAAVLTGRIRAIKDRLSISVELTKTNDGTQLWGTQINQPFSDIVETQEKITSTVLEKLKSQIAAKNSVSNSITQNPESYRFYLKGNHFLKKRTEENIYKAIEYFQKSVSLDPTNVHSYVEVVESYGVLYALDYISYEEFFIKTKPLLSVIAELNQSVDVVQAMYGRKMILDWKFEEAEKHLQYALQLNPNCLIAHYRYADFLMFAGRFSEALKEINQIMRIDPLSLTTFLVISRSFYRMGQYENAVIYLNDALELEPDNYEVLALLAGNLMGLGNYVEASCLLKKSLSIHYNLETFSMLGCINALEGKKDEAYKTIKHLQSKYEYKHAIKLARIFLALGEKETTYELLEQAFKYHDADFIALKSDPRWSSIRNESRFENLIKKVGLPT